MITCCSLHPNSPPSALPLPFGPQNSGSPPPPPLLSGFSYSGFQSRTKFFPILKHLKLAERGNKTNCHLNAVQNSQELNGALGEAVDDDEDDAELCPVDCVREFKTEEEFRRILDKAKETGSLVVVDFYRTSCGSCKYIEQGFAKLCKGSGDREADVVFLKHNVIDEYDEQSEVAEQLRIKTGEKRKCNLLKEGKILRK
ncbi:uncharacterized protein [Elaeis guineensis]|uniref:uncharacterized protein isoform X2 n=1 Tax=Elaeis guineensis var. tenera TaxID=51953 RepID=UPI00094F96C3